MVSGFLEEYFLISRSVACKDLGISYIYDLFG